MCFDRIGTDVLLANLFARGEENRYTFDELSKYHNYVIAMSGETVRSDFCEDSIRQCADHYSLLFVLEEDAGRVVAVRRGKVRPNLKFFNSSYSKDMKDFIQRVTIDYLHQS